VADFPSRTVRLAEIGLAEVTFGLLPAGGGVVRHPVTPFCPAGNSFFAVTSPSPMWPA